MRLISEGYEPENWVGAYRIVLNNISLRKGVKFIINIARHPDEGPKLDSLISKCAKRNFKIIAFNIGNLAINSFNVFKRIYEP